MFSHAKKTIIGFSKKQHKSVYVIYEIYKQY